MIARSRRPTTWLRSIHDSKRRACWDGDLRRPAFYDGKPIATNRRGRIQNDGVAGDQAGRTTAEWPPGRPSLTTVCRAVRPGIGQHALELSVEAPSPGIFTPVQKPARCPTIRPARMRIADGPVKEFVPGKLGGVPRAGDQRRRRSRFLNAWPQNQRGFTAWPWQIIGQSSQSPRCRSVRHAGHLAAAQPTPFPHCRVRQSSSRHPVQPFCQEESSAPRPATR